MSNDTTEVGVLRQRLQDEADRHLRLVEALEYLAKAEEAVAAVLVELGLNGEADEMLQRSVTHVHRASEEMRQAKNMRQQELDLLNQAK
jgi:hypothetical protein